MKRSMIVVGVLAGLLGSAPTAGAETAPMAVDDYAETDGKTVQIYVLANDSGDFDPSTLILVSTPIQGNATVIATGSPRIKYSASGSGTDTFQYSVCNSAGACSTATVTVNIGAAAPTTTTVTTTTTTVTTTTVIVASTQPPPDPTTPTTEVPPTPAASAAQTPLAPSSATSPTSSLPLARITPTPADPLADLGVGSSYPLAAQGTTVGEAHEIDVIEDVAFLGRSGADTLKLVAVPAVMVSGIVGFLLIGLPQNALGGLLGLLVGSWRRDEKKRAEKLSAISEGLARNSTRRG